ncbi:MAG TPA: pilus assembly protein TadG-related protein [Sphingomicrobium sp.]
MRCPGGKLLKNSDGAVAPTIALSLVGLIAVGGIAFDYSRLASMDTELQTAADQATLAAAAQLDGEAGACSRAANAAVSMLVNETRMANDGNVSGRQVTIPLETACDATGQVRFWQNITKTTAATTDANAKFVEITVDSRTANYALTPIAAAFSSGAVSATAFAGLDSAICKVPPLMLCNPNESSDPSFTTSNYVGKGVRLVANDGGGIYGPGNFGFLDVGAGNGATTLREELGASNVPGNCVSASGVSTETGSIITVRDALNTRFGIYDGGSLNQPCGNDGSGCPPSVNIRKDLVLNGTGNTLAKLGISTGGGSSGWKEADNPYPGVANITTAGTNYHSLLDSEIVNVIAPMGYPEDKCHAFKSDGTGACSGGRIGDGAWDRYAYFRSNSASYPTITDAASMNTFLAANMPAGTTTPTRYQVYQWEMNNASTRLNSQAAATGYNAYSRPADLAGEPGGLSPSSTQVDRRVLTVAVVNCTAEGVSGHTTDVAVKKFIDIFLVQPSLARSAGVRTENGDVYVEIIGATENASNEGAVQLVKKSIPYLIE